MKFKLIPASFYQEILAGKFDNFYIETSGGYHSTYTVLDFYQRNIKNCYLLHNETYLEYQECKNNIYKLVNLTGYPLIVTEPNFKKYVTMSNLMKISFQNVPKAKVSIAEGKHNYRDFFPCCKILKKYPAKKWIKDNILPNSLVISSLTPYESFNRQMRLLELKKQNTYVRNHKTKGCFVAYPYRDLFYAKRSYTRNKVEGIFEYYLRKNGLHAKHSGCKFCPIRILYPDMLTENDCSIKYNEIYSRK